MTQQKYAVSTKNWRVSKNELVQQKYALSAKTCCVSKNSLWGLNKRCWVSKICCLSKNRPIEQNMLCHQKLISPQKFLVITQQKYAVWANIWWVSNMSSFSKNTLWQHARHCSSLWRTNHTLATVCRQPPPRNSRAYGTAADGTQGIGLGFYTRFSLCADSCRPPPSAAAKPPCGGFAAAAVGTHIFAESLPGLLWTHNFFCWPSIFCNPNHTMTGTRTLKRYPTARNEFT